MISTLIFLEIQCYHFDEFIIISISGLRRHFNLYLRVWVYCQGGLGDWHGRNKLVWFWFSSTLIEVVEKNIEQSIHVFILRVFCVNSKCKIKAQEKGRRTSIHTYIHLHGIVLENVYFQRWAAAADNLSHHNTLYRSLWLSSSAILAARSCNREANSLIGQRRSDSGNHH